MQCTERTVKIEGAKSRFGGREGVEFEVSSLDARARYIVEKDDKTELTLTHSTLFNLVIEGGDHLDIFMGITECFIRIRGKCV